MALGKLVALIQVTKPPGTKFTLKPKFITWIFFGLEIASLAAQGAGELHVLMLDCKSAFTLNMLLLDCKCLTQTTFCLMHLVCQNGSNIILWSEHSCEMNACLQAA